MPRSNRMIVSDEQAVYHVVSRTALDGFPFGDIEKDEFVKILKRLSGLYFAEILGYCIMSNHIHILLKMHPGHTFSDDDIRQRYRLCYGDEAPFPEGRLGYYRKKWESLSEFVKEAKQTFSRFYNKRHNRRGTLWGERFKSVIVENGETLLNCLAYIDLNPVRAGIVKRPDDYRWSSLGYHAQTGNADGFLSTDFGLVEFGNLLENERFRRYRRFVYEAGAITRSDGKSSRKIESNIVDKEREKSFEVSKTDHFRSRTRYFTDSGIIGTKAFVSNHYQAFKYLFQAKREKIPRAISGLDGVYSLKRLVC